MKKEASYKDNLEILREETEILYFVLEQLAKNQLPELAELVVQVALRDILVLKQYKDPKDLTVEDFIDATRLGTAYLESASGQKRH